MWAETTAALLAFIEKEGVACDLTLDGAAALDRAAPETGVTYFDDGDNDPEATIAGRFKAIQEVWQIDCRAQEKLLDERGVERLGHWAKNSAMPGTCNSELLRR